MRCVLALLMLGLLTTPATGDVAIDLRAADPVASFPVISANRKNFMRAYRRWRKGCKQADVFVEDGAIEPTVRGQLYSWAPLLGGCGEPIDKYEGNVGAINAAMKSKQCGTAAVRGQISARLPASFDAAGIHVDVTATATSVHITINRLDPSTGIWTGGRRMTMGIPMFEVRGWYSVEVDGQRQVAVLLAGTEADGTIAERWMEVWATRSKPRGPIDIARTWLLAMAVNDKAALARVTSAPFERVGFGTDCATRASKDAEVAPMLDCMVAASSARYMPLYDEEEFSAITTAKLPAELKPSADRIAALAKAGHALIQFETRDGNTSVVLVLAVKNGKVAAVFEHVKTK